ncbi:MAG: ABC transporter permease subunit [Bryobacteraceae bacterium]|jgi:peptide/nickel transport system permease protein
MKHRDQSGAARPSFWRAALRRLLCLALTIVLAALLAAALVRVAPGFGVDERRLDPRLSESSVRALEAESANDANLIRYFGRYLAGLCRGELGQSVSFGQPVRELIAERLAVSVRSAAAGMAWAWATATLTALALGMLRSRAWGLAATILSGGLLCLPAAVIALLALYAGVGPGAAIGAILLPRILRYVHSITGAMTRRPHVLCARARGVEGPALLVRHVWLPASAELLALIGVSVNMALGATIPVEALCDSPGVGQLVWQAALARDLPVVVNVTILIAAITASANLLSDAVRSAMWREA